MVILIYPFKDKPPIRVATLRKSALIIDGKAVNFTHVSTAQPDDEIVQRDLAAAGLSCLPFACSVGWGSCCSCCQCVHNILDLEFLDPICCVGTCFN